MTSEITQVTGVSSQVTLGSCPRIACEKNDPMMYKIQCFPNRVLSNAVQDLSVKRMTLKQITRFPPSNHPGVLCKTCPLNDFKKKKKKRRSCLLNKQNIMGNHLFIPPPPPFHVSCLLPTQSNTW